MFTVPARLGQGRGLGRAALVDKAGNALFALAAVDLRGKDNQASYVSRWREIGKICGCVATYQAFEHASDHFGVRVCRVCNRLNFLCKQGEQKTS
jgi:hypothetical protein